MPDISELDLLWAYNYNTFLDEAVLAMTICRAAREAPNPYPIDVWQHLVWERGLKEYELFVASRTRP